MAGDRFYKLKAWRNLRDKTRRKWKREGLPCGYCGKPIDRAVKRGQIVDHIKPRHTHPHLELDESNLMVVYHACNSKKAAWDDRNMKPDITAEGYPIGSEWDDSN